MRERSVTPLYSGVCLSMCFARCDHVVLHAALCNSTRPTQYWRTSSLEYWVSKWREWADRSVHAEHSVNALVQLSVPSACITPWRHFAVSMILPRVSLAVLCMYNVYCRSFDRWQTDATHKGTCCLSCMAMGITGIVRTYLAGLEATVAGLPPGSKQML